MGSRRFYFVLQRILEHKRAEKRARENMHRFHCDPKRHWKTSKHPVASETAKRCVTAQAEPLSPSIALVPPPRGIPTERPARFYATLPAPATAADNRPCIRRRPKGINAKTYTENNVNETIDFCSPRFLHRDIFPRKPDFPQGEQRQLFADLDSLIPFYRRKACDSAWKKGSDSLLMDVGLMRSQ